MLYERKRSPHMVNIPRVLFSVRTSLEPRYHVAIEELQDWTYMGNRLVLLKGYPCIVWERPNRTGARATWRTLSSLTDASGPRTHKLSLRFTNRSMNMRFDPSSLFEDARALSRKVRGRRGPMGNLAHARIMNSIRLIGERMIPHSRIIKRCGRKRPSRAMKCQQ